MADIIEFNNKLKKQEQQKAKALKSLELHIIRNMSQCSQCHLRCARCGSNIQGKNMSDSTSLPFHLCEPCLREYKTYKECLETRTPKKRVYWLNKEWITMWENWVTYQNSIKNYRESKEFLKLLNEIRKDY